MSRGGGQKVKDAMKDVPVDEVRRIEDMVRARSDAWTFGCLEESLHKLAEVLEQKEKVKKTDTVETLATRICPMIDTVCGLVKYYQMEIREAESVLDDVVKENNLKNKALSAKFEIRLGKIIESLKG